MRTFKSSQDKAMEQAMLVCRECPLSYRVEGERYHRCSKCDDEECPHEDFIIATWEGKE